MGKAKNLKDRVSSYFANKTSLFAKTRLLVDQVKKIKITVVESELESLLLEATYIKKFSPKFNVKLTDGKEYPLIRITYKDTFPAVVIARRMLDPKSLYFGPYPNAGAMKFVLRTVRKIFPFQSTLNHSKQICLYHHLGLCPCVTALCNRVRPYYAQVGSDPRDNLLKEYKRNIKHLAAFLNGDTKKVISDLENEREIASKIEDFEKASAIQKQIDAIEIITHPVHKPFEYDTNPNLRLDIRQEELKSLQEILWSHNLQIDLPRRIECYDNSNFQGTNPTSSMVVLTDGEIDKSQYRKFKIKTVKGPNDFASMQEVLRRRLNHPEWPLPQLFIVDGGKGQVSAAKEILNLSLQGSRLLHSVRNDDMSNLPLIGLAKREEIIITPDLQEIRLPKNSPALKLVMRIRDEAHRFAITYHRKLRSKSLVNSG